VVGELLHFGKGAPALGGGGGWPVGPVWGGCGVSAVCGLWWGVGVGVVSVQRVGATL